MQLASARYCPARFDEIVTCSDCASQGLLRPKTLATAVLAPFFATSLVMSPLPDTVADSADAWPAKPTRSAVTPARTLRARRMSGLPRSEAQCGTDRSRCQVDCDIRAQR